MSRGVRPCTTRIWSFGLFLFLSGSLFHLFGLITFFDEVSNNVFYGSGV